MNLSALSCSCARRAAAVLPGLLLLTLASGWSFAADSPPPRASASATAGTGGASGKPLVTGGLQICGAWARATVANTPVAAAYLTITNRGTQADTLLGASSDAARSATFHHTMHSNGMAHMRATGEISIAAGQVLRVAPNGLHLMLNGLRQPLAAGAHIPVVLKFRRAGEVTVQVEVVPLTAAAPTAPRRTDRAQP
jgi:periplasmic copper chaperone A